MKREIATIYTPLDTATLRAALDLFCCEGSRLEVVRQRNKPDALSIYVGEDTGPDPATEEDAESANGQEDKE